MSTAHEPGPWLVDADGDVTNDAGGVVAIIERHGLWSTPARCGANARLIAAAPDLLEALRRVRHVLNSARHAESLIQQVDDAIAKAEGKR